MEKITFGHLIDDQNTAYFNLLHNFNVGLVWSAGYVVSFLVILGFSLLLNELTDRVEGQERRTKRISKRIASAVKSFGINKRSATGIGVFVLFVNLFIWVTQNLLTNNIKTNKVVSF